MVDLKGVPRMTTMSISPVPNVSSTISPGTNLSTTRIITNIINASTNDIAMPTSTVASNVSTQVSLSPSLSSSSFDSIRTVSTSSVDSQSSSGVMFLSVVLFMVTVALLLKIIISNRKRPSDLIGGTARWRLAASQQSSVGPQQTTATYAPMGERPSENRLDRPGPDRLDWERQFFDDTASTAPSRLHLGYNRS